MVPFFKDYFSGHSRDYLKFRPQYPASLFSYLSGLAPGTFRALDCAAGNGQAASGLAAHFRHVFATDGSFQQVEHSAGSRNIRYTVSLAERCCFQAESFDLITVAQAIHWFDFAAFFDEVDRLLVQDGILAFWCYGLAQITPKADEVIRTFYSTVLGPYWPSERKYIEERYRSIPLPMEEIPAPSFAIRAEWDLPALLGYLETWSAVKRYRSARQQNPFHRIHTQLRTAWGEKGKREINWPIYLRIGRKK